MLPTVSAVGDTERSVETVVTTGEEEVGTENSVALAISVSDSKELSAADVLGVSAIAVEACMTLAIGLVFIGKLIDSMMYSPVLSYLSIPFAWQSLDLFQQPADMPILLAGHITGIISEICLSAKQQN